MQQTSGVLWITGYSGAGKTTVAGQVARILRAAGHRVVALDGDNLREIFGGGWGYDEESRRRLAGVYFRLCRHLERQGNIVVISAVAMFAEVEAWVREHIANSHIAYLDVPHEVRVARDAETKHVYAQAADVEAMYDEPTGPDLRVENFGGVSPDESASKIAAAFLAGLER